jgi:fatty-acyl-CoA synthase
MFTKGLERREANFSPLTPIDFVARAAEVHGDRLALVYGDTRRNWRETYARTRQLASALTNAGVRKGETVAALLPNTPPMIEAHFGVPMAGAVLNTLNTRLDAGTIAFMLKHGEARALIVDAEFAHLVQQAVADTPDLRVIVVNDAAASGSVELSRGVDYEQFLSEGDTQFMWHFPVDEWDAIALNYTSGTTGDPKGVVYHHRGAYTAALSNILEWDLPTHAVYLWTLPLFHCNGWCFPWTIAARAGVNVCLRRFDARTVFQLIRDEQVTHYCGAPIVQSTLANAPAEWRAGINHRVSTMVAGASPAPAVIARMREIGFDLTHTYGLTETYGPAAVCAKQPSWMQLCDEQCSDMNARQGVRYHLQTAATVLDPDTLEPVPHDGETIGELMFRGNMCMKGYLKNEKATEQAFRGGWFRTGDLGVVMEDGYIQIRDRSKDIIISGGENISSIEVENALYRHPAISVAAVVAMPDERWGEVPCAFVELKEGEVTNEEAVIAHCRSLLAGYKVPKAVRFGILPKTSTGKIQKFELRARVKSLSAIDTFSHAGDAR